MNISQINEQINETKARVASLDNGGKSRLFYEILGYDPAISNEYYKLAIGNNKTGSCVAQFNAALDAATANSSIVELRVILKNNKSVFGDTKIVLKQATYNTPIIVPAPQLPQTQQPAQNQPAVQAAPEQAPPIVQSNSLFGGLGFLQLLGINTQGLNGADEQTANMNALGAILQFRDSQTAQHYAARDRENEINRLSAELAAAKAEKQQLEREITSLNGTIDKQEDELADLEEKLSEYEKLNPKRDLYSGIAAATIQKAAVSMLVKSPKLTGLLGIDSDIIAELSQTTAPTAPQTNDCSPVQIDMEDDSPRSKASTQITVWLQQLSEEDFAAVYQFLTLCAQGKANIHEVLTAQNTSIGMVDMED
ncbi:MAG: hypothetical protein LBU90_07510 [Bacteroidales bacterium]|jgi:hypothetical protein|nr:hypothetical protein [Bacteroidales bacterium]